MITFPQQRPQIIYPQHRQKVQQVYSILNNTIDELDGKVDSVIGKHEAEFLHAYRKHMNRIKAQLREFKNRADEQEKKYRDNNRTNYLERQLTIFREQALKLYDKLEEKTQEAKILDTKLKETEKSLAIEKLQVRELTKAAKTLEGRLNAIQSKNKQLIQQLNKKNLQISNLPNKTQQKGPKTAYSQFQPMAFTPNTRNKSYTPNQKKMRTVTYASSRLKKRGRGIPIYENQLKQWFLECVKTIKKDVAYRKNASYQFDLNQIPSIEEFKMVDKLRLLEKFMENEKMLVWMYQKIFPNRNDEIKQYLSLRNFPLEPEPEGQPQEFHSKELPSSFQTQSKGIEIALPKMLPMKTKKHQIQKRIQMKEGRLNISTF